MRCPKCTCAEDKVIETRVSKEGEAIRRRRECLSCAHRFTTRESVVRTDIVVVKRDGAREDFDPDKLRRGMQSACWKRPVSADQLDRLVTRVTMELAKKVEREVSSLFVGERVMNELHKVDQVAYVRFASVYRRFQDAEEFIDEIQNMADKN